MKRNLKIAIILIAVASLFGACTHTDSNGVTISKGWFAQADCSVDSTNS